MSSIGVNGYVVVIEGLATSLIGAYGSNVGRTPTWDKLASQGVTLDQCFVDSLELKTQLESLWSGQHALCDRTPQDGRSTLWHDLDEQRIPNRLITDCEQVAQQAEQLGCMDVTYVPPSATDEPASTLDGCVALQLFFAAAEMLRGRDEDQAGLTWIHSAGLRLPWDVPLEIRNTFVDPEDPEPPQSVEPPCFRVEDDTDPDLVVGWGQVAAAQGTVFDEGLAVLLAATQSSSIGPAAGVSETDAQVASDSLLDEQTIGHNLPSDATLGQGPLDIGDSLVVIGLGGYALGEHRFVGQLADFQQGPEQSDDAAGADQLHGELLSCVSLLIPARQDGEMTIAPARRRPELLQLPDLGVTIRLMLGLGAEQDGWGLDILGLGFADSPGRWKRCVQSAMIETAWGVWGRCPAWSILIPRAAWERRWVDSQVDEDGIERLSSDGDTTASERINDSFADVSTSSQLFVQPEDRWEVSDIADRRTDIVDELMRILVDYRRAAGQGDRTQLPEVSGELLSLMR